ncbi:MAG TPA: YdeI/OmpD-associated family protein [Candidatus Saccharimonadales bacterium]|nr:YdeI/OmpD-associated family protein [Candidatus Saccharimonadales bacterium]
MVKVAIAGGTAHNLPADLRKALTAAPKARTAWQSLTPLARNEWICWSITVKQSATRKHHIERTIAELQEGKRRPCCWIGCIHRSDKSVSPSVQWVLGRRSR